MADSKTAVGIMAREIAKTIRAQLDANNRTVISRKLQNLIISGDQILPNTIEGIHLVNGSISTIKVRDFTAEVANIAVAEIESAVIDTTQIADAAISHAKIQNAAITTAKIEDGAITHAKIGDAAIESANIKDLAVTTAKINNAAITSAKISEIDAGKIQSGQLDTALVQIFHGTDLSFIWQHDGIFAFADNNGMIDPSTYVQFNKAGIKLQRNGMTECALNWDGVYLGVLDGSVELTADDGLIVYDRPRGMGNDVRNPLVQLGRFGNAGDYEYGLRLYKTHNGITTASLKLDSSGDLWLEGALSVGSDNDHVGNILIDGATKCIGTSKFASGALGSGWRISGEGNAVFNNITARGTLASAVFEHNTISSIGGSLYVTPTLKIDQGCFITSVNEEDVSYYIIHIAHGFSGVDFHSAGRSWRMGDVVSVQGIVESNNAVYELRNLLCTVTHIENDYCLLHTMQPKTTTYTYDTVTGLPYPAGTIDLDGFTLASGAILVFIGTADNASLGREGIFLTANEEHSPYMDIHGGADTGNPKVRLGNLAGIRDTDIQQENLSGYGMYGQNVYLKGTFIAQGGRIGNLSIAEIEQNMNTIDIEISSSEGTVVKTGAPLITTLTATIYRGNMPFGEDDYSQYDILWWYSTDAISWHAISDGSTPLSGRVITTAIDSAYYVKCTIQAR